MKENKKMIERLAEIDRKSQVTKLTIKSLKDVGPFKKKKYIKAIPVSISPAPITI